MNIIDVCCAIIEETVNGSSLVWAARKDASSHLSGLWEFPGGKIEKNESGETAIAREIAEELGIEVKVHLRLAPHTHHYDTHSITLHPYICRNVSGKLPTAYEHEALALMKPSSLPFLDWAPADIPVLEEYLVGRGRHSC